jgi:hypothetical protein
LSIKKTGLFFQGVNIFLFFIFPFLMRRTHFRSSSSTTVKKKTATAATAITSSNHKFDSSGGDYQ